MNDAKKPPVDNPIHTSSEDVLGRSAVAREFARDLLELDMSAGLVVGVLGAWGSGKSSFVNLMREEFDTKSKVTVVDFNPWMFSGAQELVDVFFKELAAELRVKDQSRFGKIADGLDEYGEVLSPLAMVPGFGAWWDRSFRSYKSIRKWWRDRGAQPLHKKVADALAGLDQPVVVVIDDIDRLATSEIRDIFKLVRLTASFPNVIYVLAFDRKRVELALDEQNVPGRAYLEKIVQLMFDLPRIPRELLRAQVFDALNSILDGVEQLRFDSAIWPDVYFEVIEPSFDSLRDVNRYVLSARPTLRSLGADIQVVDLMALEAIRVFRPEVFEELQAARDPLTEVSVGAYGGGTNDEHKAMMERLVASGGSKVEGQVQHLIRRVFPAGRRYTENTSYGSGSSAEWKREHRVAHIDFLNLYLDRTAPSGLVAFRSAEKAYGLMTNGAEFGAYLDGLDPENLQDVVSNLENYEREYPIEVVVPASIELLNRISAIPDRDPVGFFDFLRPDLVMSRVVLRLLNRIQDTADRDTAIREIFAALDTYSTRFSFLRMVGWDDNAGHKLASEELSKRFSVELATALNTAHSAKPEEEWGLLRTYWFAADELGDDFRVPMFTNPDEIRSLFRSGRSVAQTSSMDSRSVRQEERLWWEGLERVLGSKEAIREANELLRGVDGDSSLVQLVDKYLGGWRPEEF